MTKKTPVVLCILDGLGLRAEKNHNAWKLAKTPFFDSLPTLAALEASGKAVGLMDGQMGNSEVGHTNIGAGRVVKQLLPSINETVENNTLSKQPVLKSLIATLKQTKSACHLWGLLSTGGVHSHQDHLTALALTLAREEIPVWWHIVTDGRDTPPESALSFMKQVRDKLATDSASSFIRFATVSGRYDAMDRNQNADRTRAAFDAIVSAKGAHNTTPEQTISDSYATGKTDEFIVPTVLGDYSGVQSGDALLIGNFRADRVRQIAGALTLQNFDLFKRIVPTWSSVVGMAQYSEELDQVIETLFPIEKPEHVLGEVIAAAGLSQMRLAETEKYAHVTFFFDGGEEHKYDRDTRVLVPSPAVATYDLQPEMSAPEVTQQLIRGLENTDVIIVNYANGDMVGHTGIESAAIKAVETLDAEIKKVWDAVHAKGGTLLITADHGNCEKMMEENGTPFTAHTTNPVPFWILPTEDFSLKRTTGKLADIAPTILKILNIQKPDEMTGDSLV